MTSTQSASLRLALAVSFTASANAQIVVDIHGGPGAQFAQIQPAITAASSDDTILVRGGQYQSFILDKPLRIVGAGFVSIDPGSIVVGIAQSERVALRSITFANLKVLACAGLVATDLVHFIAESTLASPGDTCVLEIDSCADVRMRHLGINPGADSGRDAVQVTASRFATDCCSIDGASGFRGGWGLRCEQGSVVNVSFGRVRGGNASLLGGQFGGIAIGVDGTSKLRVDGSGENEIRGGHGNSCGTPGQAVFVAAGADVRISHRIQVSGGMSPCAGTADSFVGGGVVTIASPADLTMYLNGTLGTGVAAGMTILGEVGDAVALLIGVTPLNLPIAQFAEPLLVDPVLGVPLGALDASGFLTLGFNPPGLPLGEFLLLQTLGLRADGTPMLSNTTVFVSGV